MNDAKEPDEADQICSGIEIGTPPQVARGSLHHPNLLTF